MAAIKAGKQRSPGLKRKQQTCLISWRVIENRAAVGARVWKIGATREFLCLFHSR